MIRTSIILAGGSGRRFGGETPKQFLNLLNKPVLLYSVEAFTKQSQYVAVVVHPDWLEHTRKLLSAFQNILITAGGNTRQLSVFEGLKILATYNPYTVAIHDGARPLVSTGLIEKAFIQAELSGSAIAGVSCRYTMAEVENNRITGYSDRTRLYTLQTPQTFLFQEIFNAHQEALKKGKQDYTDDSQLFEMSGRPADMIAGEETNIKITDPIDRIIAEEILKQRGVN